MTSIHPEQKWSAACGRSAIGCTRAAFVIRLEFGAKEVMPIPDYQTLMLPLLKIAGDGAIHSKRDVVPELASQFGLSEEEQKELLPSGKQGILSNRVGWARTYLKKALLIDYVQRGQFRITDRGKQVLAENPARIDNALLSRFPEFIAFQRPPRPAAVEGSDSVMAVVEEGHAG